MRGFRRVRGGFEGAGEPAELQLIANLMKDVVITLGEDPDQLDEVDDDPLAALEKELDGALLPSSDPALALLLRDMSEDPAEAEEMRFLAEAGVRSAKVANLGAVYRRLTSSDGTFVIPTDEAPAWLGAINDLRLVLAARLDIDSAERAEQVTDRATYLAENPGAVDSDEPDHQLALLYAMMSWWQDSLLDAMRFSMPRG